jgi:glucoamylase
VKPTSNSAPNGPGITAKWTSSAKTGVGTALSDKSQVWFTLSHGILNEVYFPTIDKACLRDMGLIVTDGNGFFSEEKRDAVHEVEWMADGVPGFRLVNTCRSKRYKTEKQTVSDPWRDTVLQRVRFVADQGQISDYHVNVLLAPHLGNRGSGNTAWVGEFDGKQLLFAERDGNCLALACSTDWKTCSAGYVGSSDGWQDLKEHNRLTWEYERAENGNVALAAEIDLCSSEGEFVLSLGFGTTPSEAATNAVASLKDGFEKAKHDYIAGWQHWTKTQVSLQESALSPGDLSRISVAVIRTHESKSNPGGLIASLSIPWGFSKGDDDLGGYHLVWARDMVESAGGMLAAGAHDEVRRALSYLRTTQHSDGHWSQNMWLDGSTYWDGIQMDEMALPILLVDLAYRESALSKSDVATFWPMIRKAAAYLAQNGPVSPQDRWEEDPGYSPFTVGAEIAALLAAADMADMNNESAIAGYLREVADTWNDCIDSWMYVSGNDWGQKFGVEGYYIRIGSPETGEGPPRVATVHVKNVPGADGTRLTSHMVAPDALALVRFGVRSANDPQIVDTAKVIDALLKVNTPSGSAWHRYNDDGYGEHEDGQPFDGTGIGRVWPLLTGERAHFELAAGRESEAKELLTVFESFANEGGLISEQVWDSPDIPERELHFGRPSGSAMPLVWAHAEYLKLRRSLRDAKVFDMPPQTVKRYLVEKTESPRLSWRFNHKIRSVPCGKQLRVETAAPALVHWTADNWNTVQDVSSHDTGLGIHIADLMIQSLPVGAQVKFTFCWPDVDRWEGTDFTVSVAAPTARETALGVTVQSPEKQGVR